MTETRAFLGEFELMVMLAVVRLGDEAYAVPVRRDIEERTGRTFTRGAIYITLDRLEGKGYLDSRLADPTPERGGRGKRYYRPTAAGLEAVRVSRCALRAMWDGLAEAIGERP